MKIILLIGQIYKIYNALTAQADFSDHSYKLWYEPHDVLMTKSLKNPVYPLKFILANQRHIISVSGAYRSEVVHYDFGLISTRALNMARNDLHVISTHTQPKR